MALSKISNDMFTTISRPNSSPLIVNGDMAVAQRSTSVTGKTGNGFYTCDRMELSLSGLGVNIVINADKPNASNTLIVGNPNICGINQFQSKHNGILKNIPINKNTRIP